jgi:hypothetical protein
MTLSEEFLTFAAECEFMAKFTHDRENKPVWCGFRRIPAGYSDLMPAGILI